MLAQQSLKAQAFTFTELLPGLVICETAQDIYRWGNGTELNPAFLVYLGYNIPPERNGWIARLRSIWSIDTDITYRASQRVSGYWHEIKIRGMQRYSNPAVFDLDYVSESKQYGLDFLIHFHQVQLEVAAYEEMTTARSLTSV